MIDKILVPAVQPIFLVIFEILFRILSKIKIPRFLFETQLMNYSSEGNHEGVKRILEIGGTNINCKDIWIQKSFIPYKFNHFIGFQFSIFDGIEFQDFILLPWFMLQKMVIPKLSDFYYCKKALKSTAKLFEHKPHSFHWNVIISFDFTFQSFMEFTTNI